MTGPVEYVPHQIGDREARAARSFLKTSPVTGEVLAEVADADEGLLEEAVEYGRSALKGPWGSSDQPARSALLERAAAWIEANADEIAAVESADVGRPLAAARAVNVARAAQVLRMYAAYAAAREERSWSFRDAEGEALTYSRRRPKGVVAAIVPWNVPFLLMAQKVAPALAMGNAVIAKPSEETPRSAMYLARALAVAGLPPGALSILHGSGPQIGAAICAHRDVAAVSFTGSTRTGSLIMQASGAVVRDVCLELGGKNAAIVFEDADLDRAACGVANSSFSNSGQICFCTERVYVARPVYERFLERLCEQARGLVLGAPDASGVTMGPLISHRHRAKVADLVKGVSAQGGEVALGGRPPQFGDIRDNGCFYEPTIVTGLTDDCVLQRQEVFGPVTHVSIFDDEEEVIRRANDTEYGLAAVIWTKDLSRAHRVAAAIRAGLVWVNCWQVRDLRSPVAGHGRSGVGTQGARESLEFFSDATEITVRL